MAKNSKVMPIAKYLRKNATEAEKILWDRIRNRKLEGIKFRRQMPLNFGIGHHYIADFYSKEKMIIIEIDGEIHNNEEIKEYDNYREKILKESNYKIIRFTNNDIMFRIEETIDKLKQLLQ